MCFQLHNDNIACEYWLLSKKPKVLELTGVEIIGV